MPIQKSDADEEKEELDICFVGREIDMLNEPDDLKKHKDEGQWDFVAFPLTKLPPCLEQDGKDLPSEYDLAPSTDYFRQSDQKDRAGEDVGVVSSWISTDSNRVSEEFKNYSADALREETDLAAFWGTYACILPTPDSIDCDRYAAAVNEVLRTQSTQQCRLWLRIPFTVDPQHFDGGLGPQVPAASPPSSPAPPAAAAAAESRHPMEDVPAPANGAAAASASFSNLSDEDNEKERRRVLEQGCTSEDTYDGWHIFKKVKDKCGNPQHLFVALVLTKKLPPFAYLDRWRSERVAAVIIPLECFVENSHGCPQLPYPHTQVVHHFLRQKAKVLLQIAVAPSKDVRNFERYRYCIQKLWDEIKKLNVVERAGHRDQNCLQPPLQPLAENLESGVYSVFETDSVKYARYREALKLALEAKVEERTGQKGPLVLMVVGAGRGPLVTACILAIKEVKMRTEDVKLVAIEKNPNAVITLTDKKQMEANCPFWSKLEIISSDMRQNVNLEKQADIMVSELLGSFGDNELSPECLDGAQRLLKEDGVSIPHRSVSYACPVSSTKLWTEAKKLGEKFLETPLVVYIHSAYFPAVQGAQPVFTFEHYPNKDIDPSNAHNRRHTDVDFTITIDAVVHGIAGFFSADLYGSVAISIVKETYSTDMASWWPIFFPIKGPIFVEKGDKITFSIWRCDDKHYVWYEWLLTHEGKSTDRHNKGGRGHKMGK
uniref:Protein arginine N-methyltransferase n=1 Tax=Chromera velia CCMP2878 TaxID=1169474 RepID=A0A0G4FJM8_9ALVE|eukprot:Cvel_17214.t1-p1 / transcript=Cvel_17214.t1 / gene=Cvel_17214 / organism=Chromera_velia_CCMP2878 / gene_product=Protein arginine N-methyltransferase 5, putative / transcript_product=Protein arginine N-methyltransferase 5, putative / location=Cvel_scaffold1361:44496-48804(-) / protein_length=714 / sequence_SO=supercontig / SO=protein_coding / is_pseudo=false